MAGRGRDGRRYAAVIPAKPTWADGALVLAAGVVIGWTVTAFWLAGPQAATHANVYLAGQPAGRYALNRPQSIRVEGARGVSRLEIADGAIRFVASPCRHKICIRAGALRHAHQATACLPNRVSLTLEGGPSAFDAESY